MSEELLIEIVRATGPSVATLLIVFGAVYVFRDAIRMDVLPRIGSLKALGVELTFVERELDRAADKAPAKVSSGDRLSALRRAQNHGAVLRGARALWIDDYPENNTEERNILLSLGVGVDLVRSSDEARLALKSQKYDVVISDVARSGAEKEGIRFLKEMWDGHFYRWTILYVRKLDAGTPPYAFAITNRPDHLLHYVMDVLERERI